MFLSILCKVNQKEGQATAIRNHIEANHFEEIVIPCNSCDKVLSSRNGFSAHRSRDHKNIEICIVLLSLHLDNVNYMYTEQAITCDATKKWHAYCELESKGSPHIRKTARGGGGLGVYPSSLILA